MLIKQTVNILIPSQTLGAQIANEAIDVQKNIFTGFFEQILKKTMHNDQAIISLIAILPAISLVGIAKLYDEAIKTNRII